jgi:biopolymer transport protein ExbD
MAAHPQNNDDEMITAINVTPLVDIVLVLLVILMVTASYVAAKTIPMDLPRAASGEQIPTTLAVSIDRTGALFLDAEPIDEAQLAARVKAAHDRDPEVRATVAADGAVPHARVVRVIDILRQAEVVKFAINIDPTALAAAPAPPNPEQ